MEDDTEVAKVLFTHLKHPFCLNCLNEVPFDTPIRLKAHRRCKKCLFWDDSSSKRLDRILCHRRLLAPMYRFLLDRKDSSILAELFLPEVLKDKRIDQSTV